MRSRRLNASRASSSHVAGPGSSAAEFGAFQVTASQDALCRITLGEHEHE